MMKKLLLTLCLLMQLAIVLYSYTMDDRQFLCDIRVSPNLLVVYEPLRIDIKVQYTGDTPIKALLPTGVSSLIILELINKNQQRHFKLNAYQLYTKAFAHVTPFPARVIPARASVLFSLECLYDWHKDEFLLSSPGSYEVVVQCLIPIEEHGEVQVKRVNTKAVIKVRDYQGDDLKLWKLSSIPTILSGQTLHDDQLKNLIALVAQHPKSPYRPYALAILGGSFRGIPKEITIQQRIAYLEQIMTEYPQFPWIDYVAFSLCKLYFDTGQTNKVKTIADSILRNPWTPYVLKHELERIIKR